MNARFLTTATLTTLFAGLLPANAADPQLLNLVMPDAKVLAGVNVDQAKTSPFGQYVLSQMQLQDTHLKELTALDRLRPHPRRPRVARGDERRRRPADRPGLGARQLRPGPHQRPARCRRAAASEVYNGVTILEDPKQTERFRVPERDHRRRRRPGQRQGRHRPRRPRSASLPTPVIVQVNQWSSTQDAWVVTTVPPSFPAPGRRHARHPRHRTAEQNNAFQGIQQAAGGVKFGTNVVVTAQAQAATAQDATQIGDTLKLLASLAQLQSNGDPRVSALAQSLTVTTNGTLLNVSVSLPQDQLVAMLKPGTQRPAARRKI